MDTYRTDVQSTLITRQVPQLVPESQVTLLDRILSFSIDDDVDATLRFADRLARENDWTLQYTERVIIEYKRFLFLLAVHGRPLTPSDSVDQAWHLHLVYTHSYWDRLCGGLLKRPLHHRPTRGGSEEAAKFWGLYESTLSLYKKYFGSEPPSDIWPSSRERFSARFSRVDLKRNWVIPKLGVNSRLVRLGVTLAVGAGLTYYLFFMNRAASASVASIRADTFGTASLVIWVGVLAIAGMNALFKRRCDACGHWGMREHAEVGDSVVWRCNDCGNEVLREKSSGSGCCGCG